VRFENSVDIAAPVERLWALTERVQDWPTFSPTMTSVVPEGDGPLAVGALVKIKQPGQRSKVWTVTQLVPGEVFAWETKLLGSTVAGIHEVRPSPAGCTNHIAVQMTGGTSRVVGTLLGPMIRRALRQENAGFKAQAESSS
jgi:uncharacterized membrane protein